MKNKKLSYSLVLVLASLFLTPVASNAQLLDKLKKKAKDAVDRGVDKSMDRAVNKAIDKPIDKGLDKAENAIDGKGKGSASGGADVAGGKATGTIKSYSKYDFVPGEKVLYAEDFGKESIGELPVNWNSNAGGVVMTLDGVEGKWVKLAVGTYLVGSTAKTFGKDYTIEFDMVLNAESKSGYYLPSFTFGALASGKDANDDNKFLNYPHTYNAFEVRVDPKESENTMMALHSFENNRETFRSNRTNVPSFGSTLRKTAHYSIWVQGSRVRVWINEVKVFDVPKAVNTAAPINQLFFTTLSSGGYNDGNFDYLVSNLKVAAGAPDTRSKLITEGKFSTTGILFDVNSDKIKPQSYGTLKEIATVLKENADVRVKIVGHTDSDGSASSNLNLSKKRAEAVKVFLNKEFSIETDRLETDGKGASQPVAENKTAAGKASNRRVEFIKL